MGADLVVTAKSSSPSGAATVAVAQSQLEVHCRSQRSMPQSSLAPSSTQSGQVQLSAQEKLLIYCTRRANASRDGAAANLRELDASHDTRKPADAGRADRRSPEAQAAVQVSSSTSSGAGGDALVAKCARDQFFGQREA